MNLPGFNAEASSYKSSGSYSGSIHTSSGYRSQIVPATFFPWIGLILLEGVISRGCDWDLLKIKANNLCESVYEQAFYELGYEVTADCEASGYGHDSECNPTGGTCDCQYTDMRPI